MNSFQEYSSIQGNVLAIFNYENEENLIID